MGDTLTEPYGVMSLHELFHADLDESTNYGRLLCAYNGLALSAGPGSVASRTFATLREWCRISHETYATYLSLLSFADPGFDDLGQYVSGRYLDYLHKGEQLTGDLRSRFLRQQVAVACLQLCMQAPVVAVALDRGLEVFLPRDLSADHRPDVRLRAIASFVGRPGFWPTLLSGLPAPVISAVVPMLFDVNQVKLTPSEDRLLAALTVNDDARALTAEQMYDRLPDRLQEQVTELELRDFLDRCFRAGSADYVEDESGERSFHLYPQGRRRFRIMFV